jgi:predicted Zn-dependent peptidase
MRIAQKKVLARGLFVVAACVVGVLALTRNAVPQQRSDTANRVVLDNGLTVLLYPVPGADRVAVESFYRVGFLHEPKGMTQAAHLVEHLVCQCATQNYRAGESMRLLNQRGMANAETLADLTHYDYVLPASDLELVLRIEAERLSSLRITSEVIRQEAPKCYQEAAFVEQNPQAGIFKHAFMAFNQVWQHGMSQARVRGGLEDIPPADLERFYRAFYHPKNLVLVLVGGFNRDEALQLVNKHLRNLPSPQTPPTPSLSWAKVPKETTVQWDSKVRAACLGFPPPDDVKERAFLSLWGNLLMQRLMTDREIQGAADSVFCTNQLWGVGTLPFFVYATAKPDVNPLQLQRLLMARLQSITSAKPGNTEMTQLRFMAAEFARPPELKWDAIRQQAQALAAQLNQDPRQATGMMLGNIAIQLGVRELLLGSVPAPQVQALQSMTADDLHGVIKRTLDPSKQFVTTLVPMQK